MKLYNFIPYFYLFIAALFIYDGITKYLNSQDYYLNIAVAAVAIFMFFFRKKYAKKMEDHHKNKQQ
ncbi:hypothetical protein [Flavobacterium sp. HSC-61S13]|uniref:hypothetical protein n=1 Tax=Flavobacterium sp. HSC-61S13 TaxID=2910963 RepID=UPI0020A17CE9|nr:hypothetical protein [Flavobacterium sp. HSC-61S13]MCP1996888.1 low affinity Fe/Cu permease [Flavobacterium sp. HSC-61S13]